MCDGSVVALAKTEIKRRRYTTELPEELAERLEAICETTLRTKPVEIRLAVEAWVDQHEKTAP